MSLSYKKPSQYAATQGGLNQQAILQQQAALMQTQMQAAMYNGTSTTTAGGGLWSSLTTTNNSTLTVTVPVGTSFATAVSNGLYSSQHLANPWDSALVRDTLRLMGDCVIEDGVPANVHLPDGSVLMVGADGSFIISDKDAKVTYRANRVRDFNPFINASDKLEGFIKFCGALGVKQDEMLNLPVSLFIKWLIVQAAMADGEEPDEEALLAQVKRRAPRCTCGRFLPRKLAARKIKFCRPVCLERELEAA